MKTKKKKQWKFKVNLQNQKKKNISYKSNSYSFYTRAVYIKAIWVH